MGDDENSTAVSSSLFPSLEGVEESDVVPNGSVRRISGVRGGVNTRGKIGGLGVRRWEFGVGCDGGVL